MVYMLCTSVQSCSHMFAYMCASVCVHVLDVANGFWIQNVGKKFPYRDPKNVRLDSESKNILVI